MFRRHQECIPCLRHGDRVRVAIITESFLPSINGVTGTVLQVLDHLDRGGHPALVVAPGEGTTEHRGTPVIRVPAVDLPRLLSIPVGLPWRGMYRAVARFAPDVVHLASPFVVGAHGLTVARVRPRGGGRAGCISGPTARSRPLPRSLRHSKHTGFLGSSIGVGGVDTGQILPRAPRRRPAPQAHTERRAAGGICRPTVGREACGAAGSHCEHGKSSTGRRRRWATPGRAATAASQRQPLPIAPNRSRPAFVSYSPCRGLPCARRRGGAQSSSPGQRRSTECWRHCARADGRYAWTPSSPAGSGPASRLPRLARHKTATA